MSHLNIFRVYKPENSRNTCNIEKQSCQTAQHVSEKHFSLNTNLNVTFIVRFRDAGKDRLYPGLCMSESKVNVKVEVINLTYIRWRMWWGRKDL